MKIFYTCNGAVLKPFYDLNKILSDSNRIKSSFFITDKAYAENFLKKNKIKLKNSIKEWELIEDKKKQIKSFKILKNIINNELIWKAAVADRRIYNGIYSKYTQDYKSHLNDDYIKKLICFSYEKIYYHLKKFKPDVIISHSTGTFGIYLVYLISKKLRINFVNLRHTKINNYVTFTEGINENYNHIRKKLIKKKFSKTSYTIAKKFISNYRFNKNFKYVGSPYFKLNSKLLLLESLKNFPRAVLSEIKYFFSSNNDFHSLNHPFKTYYFENIIRFVRSLVVNKFVYKKIKLKNIGKYAFFPLHAEPELSLSVLANSYQNQIETIRNLSFRLPPDTKLVVKDHPRNFCRRKLSYLNKINQIPNVILIDPRVSTRELIKNSHINIVLSGFIGFEAVILKKPVITFSKTIINILSNDMVLNVKNFDEFENKYFDFLKNYKHDEKKLENFIASIVESSAPIDLINVLFQKKNRHGKRFTNEEYQKNLFYLKKLLINYINNNLNLNFK